MGLGFTANICLLAMANPILGLILSALTWNDVNLVQPDLFNLSVNLILVGNISKSYYQYPAFMRLLDMCFI